MLEFQQKRKIRRLLYSPVSLILLAIVAVIFIKGAWSVYEKEAASKDYLTQAQSELAKVSVTQENMAQSVAALQTEQGVESDIRQKFHVVKPGEQIAVIMDSDASDSSATASSSTGFWAWLAGFF